MRTISGVFTQQPAAGATQEYSLWGTSSAGTAGTDSNNPILGTKFTASTNGSIVGIRWQRVSGTNGALDIALFQGSTNISGTTTVTGQTASGWQRMDFGTPVAITAGTLYIAVARYASPPQYHSTGSFFASAFTNGPLTAVSNATSVNGVYGYGTSMAVPTSTYQSACYYTDVVFSA